MFRTVFVLVWNTVFFGMWAGLMLVPVVLSFWGGGVHRTKAAQLFSLMDSDAHGGSFAYGGGRSHNGRRVIPMA